MKQEPVAFSIVGCGRIGHRHAHHIRALGRLEAACDTDPAAREAFVKEYPDVPCYASIEELLEKDRSSDVVNVCTPNGLHAEHSILALRAGKHVVCEKPMTLTVPDAKRMIEESGIAGKHLFVVKQNRYNPPVEKLKSVLDRGILGELWSAQLNCFWNRSERYYRESSWKGRRDLDGGILFTQFSHFIDLLYWYLGDVEEVTGLSKNYGHRNIIEFEDTLVAVLRFRSGVLATVNCTVNSYGKNMEGSITLFCENGTVKVGGQYLNVLEYQNIRDHTIGDIESHRPPNEYGFYQGSMSNHDKVIANVIDVLEHDGKIATTGFEGMKTVEIIERIYAASRDAG